MFAVTIPVVYGVNWSFKYGYFTVLILLDLIDDFVVVI